MAAGRNKKEARIWRAVKNRAFAQLYGAKGLPKVHHGKSMLRKLYQKWRMFHGQEQEVATAQTAVSSEPLEAVDRDGLQTSID